MSHDPAASAAIGMDSVWTIVVAGGSGLRFGMRKQFVDLHGVSVLQRSVNAAGTASSGVVVVVPEDVVDTVELVAASGAIVRVVAGGDSRAASVRPGLDAIAPDCSIVLVHDAARPLASVELFAAVVDAVRAGADAVVPAIAVADTIRRRSGGVVDREDLLAVQTPQGFPAASLRAAHASSDEATDDATLVERSGGTVGVMAGEAANRKITEPVDLVTAAAVLRAAEGATE